jgi:hypothetical protein
MYYSMSNEIDLNTTLTETQQKVDDDDDYYNDEESSRNNSTNREDNDDDGEKISDRLNEKLEQISNDPSLDLFIYKIKFTMFSLTVLLKDPQCDDSTKMLGDYMKPIANAYFDCVSSIKTSGLTNNFIELRQKFYEASAFNDHLLLLCKPIKLELTQKLNSNYLILTDIYCTIGYLDLVEYLATNTIKPSTMTSPNKNAKLDSIRDAQISELLKFDIGESMSAGHLEPCFKFKYFSYEPNLYLIKHLNKNNKYKKQHIKFNYPNKCIFKMDMSLNKFFIDFDVSIYDRLYYLLFSTSSTFNTKLFDDNVRFFDFPDSDCEAQRKY